MGCFSLLLLPVYVCLLTLMTIGFMISTIVLAVSYNKHRCVVTPERVSDDSSEPTTSELCSSNNHLTTMIVTVLSCVATTFLVSSVVFVIMYHRKLQNYQRVNDGVETAHPVSTQTDTSTNCLELNYQATAI